MITAAEARAVLARHASTFSRAARLLPGDIRDDMAILYAFCRHIDDLADEADDAGAARTELAILRDDLLARRARSPLVAGFLDLAERHDVPILCALDLVDGVAQDLEVVAFDDADQLVRYGYRVAGTVGVMSAGLLGARGEPARRFAADLGIGMQLTNIARDVAEDLGRGRRYVPAELIAPARLRAAVERGDPLAGRDLLDALERLLQLADRYYASGERGIALLRPDVRWGILTAARSYRAIGPLVLARGPRRWAQRVHTSTLQKACHAAGAALSLLAASFRESTSPRAEHDRSLHAPLLGLRSATVLSEALAP